MPVRRDEAGHVSAVGSPIGRGLLAAAFSLTLVCTNGLGLARDASAADSAPGSSDAFALDGTAAAASPGPSTRDQPDARIADAIETLIEPETGVFGIVLMRPDGEVLYTRNARTPFVSASLYKLILLADILIAVDAGMLSLDTPLYLSPEFFRDPDSWDAYYGLEWIGGETTVAEALFAAGAYSSNAAAMALFSLTTLPEVNRLAAELGLYGTFLFTNPFVTPVWPPKPSVDATAEDALRAEQIVLSYATDGQVNLTTPFDMARYFKQLMSGEIGNERVSAMIMEILDHQTINDRIPALLPEGTRVAHKTGNLDRVIHDVGIIWAPDGPMILAALIEDAPSKERGTQILQRLGLIAYGTFTVPPLASPDAGPAATPVALDGTATLT
jgi:beta-lactamase class A